MLDKKVVPKDLQLFESKYIKDELGLFLQARHKENNALIGVVGMSRYDHRFSYLDYKDKRVVEVARLYVDPSFRRRGLATELVEELKKTAREKNIEVLYLHTHPFLSGAIAFWEKQGFDHLLEINEQGLATNHMQLKLTNMSKFDF